MGGQSVGFAALSALMLVCMLACGSVHADLIVDDFQAVAAEATLATSTFIDTVSAGACEPSAGGQTGKILGGCHVVSMRGQVEEGCNATAAVRNGVFVCDNTNGCAGECTLQLDGADTSPIRSLSLNTDLLALGSGFRFSARSNIGSAFTFRVYTTHQEISRAVRNVPSGEVDTEFAFNFARDFAGNANFSAAHAIEIEVPPEAGKRVEFFNWQIISPFVEIAGQVYEDCSCDGERTPFDVPAEGVTVNLLGDELCRTRSATAVTDSNGVYEFTGLTDCDYEIAVDEEEEGELCEYQANPVEIVLRRDSVSQRNFAIDSGCHVPGGVRGFVFEDVACDGLRSSDEIGLAGISVTVASAAGCSFSVLETVTTEASGRFVFDDLPPCAYTVTIPSYTANLCPGSFTSQSVTVLDGEFVDNVLFRARAPSVWVLDDLLADTFSAVLGDTLGIAQQVSESACDANNGGRNGTMVGGCHVVTVTGVGTRNCNPASVVEAGGFVCANPSACGARCRLLLDGVKVNTQEDIFATVDSDILLGLEENLLARGDAMRVSAYSTQPIRITATVFSSDGATSSASFVVPGFNDEATFDLNFARDFSGSANFADVGALTLEVANDPNVETVVTGWSVIDSVSADISGTIFHDCTCDLARGPAEVDNPVPGVTVSLQAAVGCPIQTEQAVTDEQGRYVFQSLPPCTYVVSVDASSTCEGGITQRTLEIGRESAFSIDFGLDFATLVCPADTNAACGSLSPQGGGVPFVCGVPEGYTWTDDITCRGNFDDSITHITRTFNAGGLSCDQELEVLELPLDPIPVDPFEVEGAVLRIDSTNGTVTVADVIQNTTVIGGVREITLVGEGFASEDFSCEPLAGAVPNLGLLAVPPCAGGVTARYDGNPDLGLNYDSMDIDLPALGDAFLVRAIANSARSITVRVYSAPSELSQVVVNTLPGQETDFVMEWGLFNGNADLSSTKAIEMYFSTDGDDVTELSVLEWSIVSPRPAINVTGVIFRDNNCNQQQDSTDRALPFVEVRLESACRGERRAFADVNGRYVFNDVVPCDVIEVSLVNEDILLCDVNGNESPRSFETVGANLDDVNFAVGCNFNGGQVCGDRCTPFGDPLPDGTLIERLSTCGTGDCQSANGVVRCKGGVEQVSCPTDGRSLGTTECGRGRCRRQGQMQCQGGVAVDTCTLPRDGTIVDNCGSGEGPCPGLGQVLCIEGIERGRCSYSDYRLQDTYCGAGACLGRGELRCLADGSIVDTCEPASDGTVVTTAVGLRVCQDGEESDLLEPCDIIDCSDGDPCTADTCSSSTSDCDHELPEACDFGGASAVLGRVFRACSSDLQNSLYTYTMRFYEENTPDHIMVCLGSADDFVTATDLVDSETGESVCSLAPMQGFDEADADLGIVGVRLTCEDGADLRGSEYSFSVAVRGTQLVNEANGDGVIGVKEGLMRNDYDYLRVLGPFDCDCVTRTTPNVVLSTESAGTDGQCQDYDAPSLCARSTPLGISIITPVQSAQYDLDRALFELQLAGLLRVTRYSLQVDVSEGRADRNGRVVVIVRLFDAPPRTSEELASIVQRLLSQRDPSLMGTLLEGAFLTEAALSDPQATVPSNPQNTVPQEYTVPGVDTDSGAVRTLSASTALLVLSLAAAILSLFQ
eukprot:TRINITY_DN666_c0_g1_i1.p1 TRINITY_DN666_c0_g1~~TRINITY_DN666_c0_g1_i1.p1  ORF type:complete len:1645 (-),score=667.51 TRINITY_DN666_c0_g1_i1:47-4981(-)